MTEMKGNASFSVFISAELFKPTPYGEAAAQEYPPRIPFLRPTYSLYLYTDEELKNKDLGDGYLMIGRVIMDNGQVRLDDTYVHEIAHTLGLSHTYKEKNNNFPPKYLFTKDKTDNIMDEGREHKNNNSFWKWQWEEMQKDSDLKPIDNE